MQLANRKRPSALDNAFCALLATLIWFPPLALGAVHPWPAAIAEVLAFLLMMMLAIRTINAPAGAARFWTSRWGVISAPILLLACLITFQMIPLPPGVISAISPSTFNIYARSLQGWPQSAPYKDYPSTGLAASADSAHKLWRGPMAAGETRLGAMVPFGHNHAANEGTAGRGSAIASHRKYSLSVRQCLLVAGIPPTWYPLSLSPSLTMTALLRFAAYAGLFLAVLGYPFSGGSEAERRCYYIVVVTALITGLMVASIGLLERAYWNGKILWVFVPWDWGAPLAGVLPRATGPFINPDHFGNYLAMILPIALAAALFGLPFEPSVPPGAIRSAGGIVSFVILVAILLSLSRAAWMEAAASSFVLLLFWAKSMLARVKETERSVRWRDSSGSGAGISRFKMKPQSNPGFRSAASARARRYAGGTLIAFTIAILLIFYVVGPKSRIDARARLNPAVSDNGAIGIRPAVWKATLRMAADFPVFGVGLASWPEIYPHYAAPPWNPYYFREAHNDYLQYLAETGLAGTALLALLLSVAALNLYASFKHARAHDMPLFIALVLALGTMALHEMVDFCLHVPANALLVVIFLGIALRIGLTTVGTGSASIQRTRALSPVAILMLALPATLIVLALGQSGLAYPYNIAAAEISGGPRAMIVNHPASAAGHLAFLAEGGQSLSLAARTDEIKAAVWLDPTNPWIRDSSASINAAAGRSKEALQDLTTSVLNSPALQTHFYLAPSSLRWLLPSEQAAVEHGFEGAVAMNYPGAIENLASFYDQLGNYTGESALLIRAAGDGVDNVKRAQYLSGAALAEISEGNVTRAEALLWQAIQSAPADTDAYMELVQRVYLPEKKLAAAMAAVSRGISAGADAVQLELVLSGVAESAGNEALAEKSLLKVLRYDPSFESLMRVGQFYLNRGRFDRAASILDSATETNPKSAEAFYLLGVAEENDYQYSRADEAYAHAVALAPRQFRPDYAAFRRRIGMARTNS